MRPPSDNGDGFTVDLRKSTTPWSGATKLRRGLWQFFVRPLYRLLPGKRSRLRVLLLRLMGARIGSDCYIQRGVDVLMPWHLRLGDCVVLGKNTCVLNFAEVRIGSMTVVSQDNYLCTGSHDHTHPHFPLVCHPIEIGAEVWIAAGAFVGPGTSLGRGCVVGARSVVTRNLPEWHVCAGNPCRPLKPRTMRPAS